MHGVDMGATRVIPCAPDGDVSPEGVSYVSYISTPASPDANLYKGHPLDLYRTSIT